MQGTGNDFVVIDNRKSEYTLNQLIELAPKICHRKYGVGADGLLALQKPRYPSTDFEMLYRNADGSDAGMCGNGSRCLALYASQIRMGKNLSFSVHDSIYKAEVNSEDAISITFPHTAIIKKIHIEGEDLLQVFTGTEHVVKEIPKAELENEDELVRQGRNLRHNEQFLPKGTNVNFISGRDTHSLELQTYERGVEDLTLACGTGAMASALAWHHKQQKKAKNNRFKVITKGGTLIVCFTYKEKEGVYKNMKLTGPAQFVFEGRFHV